MNRQFFNRSIDHARAPIPVAGDDRDGVQRYRFAREFVLGRRIQSPQQVARIALVIEWLGNNEIDDNFRALGHG